MGRRFRKLCWVVACMLFFSGCSPRIAGGREITVSFPERYMAAIKVVYREIPLQGDLERSASGETRLAVHSPENLSGLTLLLREGRLYAEYGELRFSVDNDAAPASAMLTLLSAALGATNGETLRPAQTEASRLLQLENEYGQLEVLLDKEDFLPERITMESLGFTAELDTLQPETSQ